ncbi:hypothetical protein [Enterococcus sp. AZ180]|uniref:hypothetical protein n=1 Tax=Enterococcus sp. AZ180 TaxID=2774961 RepID=UPI003F239AC0
MAVNGNKFTLYFNGILTLAGTDMSDIPVTIEAIEEKSGATLDDILKELSYGIEDENNVVEFKNHNIFFTDKKHYLSFSFILYARFLMTSKEKYHPPVLSAVQDLLEAAIDLRGLDESLHELTDTLRESNDRINAIIQKLKPDLADPLSVNEAYYNKYLGMFSGIVFSDKEIKRMVKQYRKLKK